MILLSFIVVFNEQWWHREGGMLFRGRLDWCSQPISKSDVTSSKSPQKYVIKKKWGRFSIILYKQFDQIII